MSKHERSFLTVAKSIFMQVLLISMLGGAVVAQTFTATLSGRTLDEAGAVVPGVTVTLTELTTGQTYTASTDDSGNYMFLLVPAGEYNLAAERQGFQKVNRQRVTLQVAQQASVDLSLAVGELKERVDVESDVSLLQAGTSDFGQVIDQRKIVELPLNTSGGREFQQLALLVPGTFPPAQGSSLASRGGFNAAGARETANYFLLDGIDNLNSSTNQYVLRPSVEIIREFKVQSSTYSAEFGRGAGAQINVVTKSGTNEFHGNLFEFHGNSAVNAKNFFDAPGKIPPFKRNLFGGTVGGPLSVPSVYDASNRTFFFFGYEGLRERRSVTRRAAVPTAAMRRGDFSALLNRATPIIIRDPVTRQPFPGNIIPPARLANSIGARVAAFFPDPNTNDPVSNFVSAPSQPQDIDQFPIRVDHRLSERDSFFARYGFNEDALLEPFDSLVGTVGTNLPGFGRLDNQRTQSLSLNYTHIFSPRAVNEWRFGYNRLRQIRTSENGGEDIGGQLGIRGISTNARDAAFPAFRVTGFDSIGDGTQLPQGRADNTFHFVDNFTLVLGDHTLKAGLDMRHFQSNNLTSITPRGDFRFTGAVTGFGLADLLLDAPVQATRGVGDPTRQRRQSSSDFYIQDDWKVTRNLTLNLGLRYELNYPTYDVLDRVSSFDPASGTILLANQNGVPRGIFNLDKNNFAPRAGFAWKPFNDDKTVIRGGYGVYYDLLLVSNELGAIIFNAPFISTQVFNGSATSPLPLANPFGGSGTSTTSPRGVPGNLSTSYLQQFSLGVQREVFRNLLFEVAYVGSKGTKLIRTRNVNQPLPGPGSIASRRPYTAFGNIDFRDSSGNSSFNSLQMRAERRFSKLTFLASYTFSKSIDDASAAVGSTGSTNSPQDSRNLRAERGLSDFDVRHRFVVSYIYEIPNPVADGLLSKFTGGWQLSGITALQSGRPITPRLSIDVSNTGQFQDRPNLVGDPTLDNPDPSLWFNTSAFTRPANFTFGSAGRDTITGPGFNSFDVGVMKNNRFGESGNIQFRAEFFNLFNRPNFNLPNATADSPQFGRIFSAQRAREIQFGLKISY